MQKNNVVEALRALATDDKARSETARLRDIIDDVEAALSAGVSRSAVLKTLHDQGFTMTEKSFESALYRIRKKKKGQSKRADKPSLTPEKASTNITQELPAKTEDNPFAKLQKTTGGDIRRNQFEYNPTPDLNKIYGDSNDE